MQLSLALLFIICHAIALAVFRPGAMAVSYAFLIAAPLLAGVVALRRCRVVGFAPSLGWSAMALAMLLWAGGMALSMRQDIFLEDFSVTPGDSMLMYILYGVPLIFVIASDGERVHPWSLRLTDGVLAAALGYLYFVYTFSLTTVNGVSERSSLVNLVLMFDTENAFIVFFAAIRYMAATERNARHFFRTLTIFAVVYTAVAAYNNHVIAFDPTYQVGNFRDLLLDIPFLVLFVATCRPLAPSSSTSPVSNRVARFVQTASPLAMALALLVVAGFVMRTHTALGMTGVALAVVGYGLRSTLVQLRANEAHEQLDVLARMDGLTGVANRRHLDEALASECARLSRADGGLALLMIDIDQFKSLNDTHGHQRGDDYLRLVAQAIAGCIARTAGLVARYGGEEFAVLLPATSLAGALEVAERVRGTVEGMALPSTTPSGLLTVSIGVGFVGESPGAEARSLLAMADRALYEAKRLGRNQVRS